MKRPIWAAVPVAALTTLALAGAPAASAATGHARGGQASGDLRAACAAPTPGRAACLSLFRTDVHGGRGLRGRGARKAGETGAATALPAGYGPADLRAAYSLPATGGAGQTVAVVDAYDDPTAEADLAVYRATYGLPACTTANGCFEKIGQDGQPGDLPPDGSYTGWSLETSLDLDMVSAACPACHIILAEGNSPQVSDLSATEDAAASAGATEISNSYGATESFSSLAYQADYTHPGIAITASTGDSGFGVPEFPAVLPTTIAVGGTMLSKDPGSARGYSETAWSSGSSGCSGWFAKPAWQTGVPDCPGRVTADVSAAADTDTGGLAVYDTTPIDYGAPSGWLEANGTSAASPLIAGIIALAGNAASLSDASYIYAHASGLTDVTSGYNATYGFDCGGDNLCNAMAGYDGPTGLGTPDGIGAF